ncbi:hypothetical protein D3C75_782460 [compost metagenome]
MRQAGELFVQALLEQGDILVELLAHLFRQLGEFGFIQRLAVGHRGEGDVAGVAVQGHVLFQRGALDHIQGAVVTLVEGAVDGAFLLLVRRVLEHRREGRQQVVDEPVHVGDERPGAAGRQLQCAGFTGVIEVVDVDPVGRGLLALALGLEVALDEREAAGAGLAHHVHVVTRARHGHAELQGLDSTLLAQDSAKRLQIVGIGKGKLLGGETPGQGFRRETQARSDRIGHWVSLLRRGRYAAFWRCPRAPCKAPQDFMSQPKQVMEQQIFRNQQRNL